MSDGGTAEQLPRILQDAIAAHYAGDDAPLLDRMASDCRTVSASGTVYADRAEFGDALNARPAAPAMTMRNPIFRLIDATEQESGTASHTSETATKEEGAPGAGEPHMTATSTSVSSSAPSGTTAMVTGTYLLCTDSDEPALFATTQHVSAFFRSTAGRWEAVHLHFSNVVGATVGQELFPLQISRETYEYVRRILGIGRKAGLLPTRIAVESSKATRYLDPTRILYVQAKGKECVVHTQHGDFPIGTLLSKLETQLPGPFVRIHRSYIVNAAFVNEIRRYTLTLTDGTKLPISERRFADVHRDVTLFTTDPDD